MFFSHARQLFSGLCTFCSALLVSKFNFSTLLKSSLTILYVLILFSLQIPATKLLCVFFTISLLFSRKYTTHICNTTLLKRTTTCNKYGLYLITLPTWYFIFSALIPYS